MLNGVHVIFDGLVVGVLYDVWVELGFGLGLSVMIMLLSVGVVGV